MIVEIENYQIRPYPNNLCWEVWKFRDVKKKDGSVKREWVSEGCYPSTLDQALNIVHERLLKEGGSVVGIEDAVKAVKAQAKVIAKAADKAAKEVGSR
ncbi:hypothetical protein [Adlercreutzia mucosicola]|uniref:hypothetical protein n=1 Tax=Adlercreutzia mucosicola TaxID=580026 RepID=UPI0004183875|nr:hypothetical protein [Adlercreutzia mucosicola]MCR2034389.1 hypothetical protein [Adlercreutzia mucosicola]